jgi:23S rRNA (uracil747-C5)-methyltransferase
MHCVHFSSGQCRSCEWLATPYADQLKLKASHLEQLFAGRKAGQWLPFFQSEKHAFRNKAKMVALGVAQDPVLGIISPAGESVNLTDCPLYSPEMRNLLQALPGLIRRAGIPPYRIDKKKGELKYVLLTQSWSDGSFLLRFVLRSENAIERIRQMVASLVERFPAIAVISVNIQPEHMAILEGDKEIFLTEQKQIIDYFNAVPLAISPKSFFQTNPRVAAMLYQTAADWISQTAARRIWDLYCGVGGFGLHALNSTVELMGIEIEPEAIRCARTSAEMLGFADRVQFQAFDATALEDNSDRLPELVIVNPPRRGIGEKLAGLLNSSNVPDLVYSSCNAETLVADLDRLNNYEVVRVQGFDMFPHTRHYEVLVQLKRSG